jgi:hypothetical protein
VARADGPDHPARARADSRPELPKKCVSERVRELLSQVVVEFEGVQLEPARDNGNDAVAPEISWKSRDGKDYRVILEG